MKEERFSGDSKTPNLGTVTPKIVELFERALAERKDLKKRIEELSSRSNPTVRDQLWLALYRQQLSSLEPQLPAGVSLTGMHLWQYSISHPEEYRKDCQIENEIRSYLEPPEAQHSRALSNKLAM